MAERRYDFALESALEKEGSDPEGSVSGKRPEEKESRKSL